MQKLGYKIKDYVFPGVAKKYLEEYEKSLNNPEQYFGELGEKSWKCADTKHRSHRGSGRSRKVADQKAKSARSNGRTCAEKASGNQH